MNDEPETVWIASVRDPDGKPVCELAWGAERWSAPVADVRQTAMDLVSCAAYAEWIYLMVTRVGLPPATVEAVTVDLMRIAGRAGHWMAAAEATESDQLVAEAFRATQRGNEPGLERLFGYLRKLRDRA